MAVTVDSGSSGDPTGAGTGDGEATSDFGDAAETGGDGDGVEAECMAAGRYERAIELDGVVHRFTVHVPASRGGMAPLVMQLHGGGSTAAAMDTVSGLTALAEQEGFVVVSPEGWAVGGGTQVWNGGRAVVRAPARPTTSPRSPGFWTKRSVSTDASTSAEST